jgi:hypothetical protein
MDASNASTTLSVSSFLAIYTFFQGFYTFGKGLCLFLFLGLGQMDLGFLRGTTRIHDANGFRLSFLGARLKLTMSHVKERDEMRS